MTDENLTGKDLRDKFEAALAENKALKAENRNFKIQATMSAKGYTNLSAAKFIPADLDVSDATALDNWFKENENDINFGKKEVTEPGTDNQTPANGQPNIDEATKNAAAAAQAANNGGASATTGFDKSEYDKEMDAAKTPQEKNVVIAKYAEKLNN